ncbi:hypothetical protein QLS71_018500 [Mariniflexile litorale]|uniref:Lipoprotein n=1 Tax=Mariniflexile litorale TaxID=3045158 RepID=A0AAU7EDY1_9FLAO|nr:hypothetical protein [Mariniflexile sp. KMM 9835]MDQ8211806.1 hypothetical protein [Mariniflexile sp. KMM 9835]
MKSLKVLFVIVTLLFFSCSSDDSVDDIITQPVTYKLISFIFTPQTETQEESLSYEIEFINSNNFEVKGLPQITTTIGGGTTVTGAPNSQCRIIPANSSCILSYAVVDDNPLLFPVEPIEFVKADYIIDFE